MRYARNRVMVSKRLGTTVCVLSKPQLSRTRERPTPLYWVIGEASLPDVDSGCFIGFLRGYSAVQGGGEMDSCGAGKRAGIRRQGGSRCPHQQVLPLLVNPLVCESDREPREAGVQVPLLSVAPRRFRRGPCCATAPPGIPRRSVLRSPICFMRFFLGKSHSVTCYTSSIAGRGAHPECASVTLMPCLEE